MELDTKDECNPERCSPVHGCNKTMPGDCESQAGQCNRHGRIPKTLPRHGGFMQKTYETEKNKNNEKEIAAAIEQYMGCEMISAPLKWEIDYIAKRDNKIVAWVEIKQRNYTMVEINLFGGYMLSLKKWMMAKSLFEVTGIKFALAISALDGVFIASFDCFYNRSIILGGRTDRSDPEDVEPCVLIPTNKFFRIGERINHGHGQNGMA